MFIGVKTTILLHAKKTGDLDKIEIVKKQGHKKIIFLTPQKHT